MGVWGYGGALFRGDGGGTSSIWRRWEVEFYLVGALSKVGGGSMKSRDGMELYTD